MTKYIFLFLFLGSSSALLAQKPPLDLESQKNWASVSPGGISSDGNYVYYTLTHHPTAGNRKLVVESTVDGWKKEFPNASEANFTNDSKSFVFKLGTDTLCFAALRNDRVVYIQNVKNYKTAGGTREQWLAYALTTPENELVLRNLGTGKELRFPSVTSYQFDGNAKYLAIQTQAKIDSVIERSLLLADLSVDAMTPGRIGTWKEKKVGDIVFAPVSDRLAFILEDEKSDQSTNELWYFNSDMDEAIKLIGRSEISEVGENLSLARNQPEFSIDGLRIYFGLQKAEGRKPNLDAVKVNIWSYHDALLQPSQLRQLSWDKNAVYKALVRISDRKIIKIGEENEQIVGKTNDYLLVKKWLGNESISESFWNRKTASATYLVSAHDGSRKQLEQNYDMDYERARFALSPSGKWLLYYNFDEQAFFSYETATGVVRNITHGATTKWIDEKDDRPEKSLTWHPGRWTWLANDEVVFLYDNYDIWLVDPSGKKEPENFTNGYGRKHKIKFELVDEGQTLWELSFVKGKTIWLKAFNTQTKKYGFFSQRIGSKSDPEQCIMGPYVFGWWLDGYIMPPTRAKESSTYLYLRMGPTEAPNLFVTRDFKNWKQLTDVQPHKKYNWYTAELHTWRKKNGEELQGILYKPENFDKTKKYPVIFNYYEIRSDGLNVFWYPAASESDINIPLFVSQGYLVFVPDITFEIGKTGQSAVEAVESAADYLAKMPFVDTTRMGLQGHSFGGFETGYIVTHSDRFAAACAIAGIYNRVSNYLSDERGTYHIYHSERIQGRMGGTLWQVPEQYLENSAVLRADKVATPLLMVHGRDDRIVDIDQSIQFFNALRRLGRRSWLLEYEGQGHTLDRGKVAEDFHTRMMQFFDHYLKGKPAPMWMTRGIPAKDKGFTDGLELDNKIKTPGPGLLIQGSKTPAEHRTH